MAQTYISLKMIYDRWYASLDRAVSLLSSLTDETLQKRNSPRQKSEAFIYWVIL